MKRGEDSMLTPLVPLTVSILNEDYIDTAPCLEVKILC